MYRIDWFLQTFHFHTWILNFLIRLTDSHPESKFSVQRYELAMTSEKTEQIRLFRYNQGFVKGEELFLFCDLMQDEDFLKFSLKHT